MSPEALFDKLEQHYQQSLPFVVYSRPINSIIKCWLQQDAILNETVDFSEEGFVFAPFNLEQKTILFRAYNSEHYSVETHSLDVEPTEDNDYNSEVTLKDEHIKLVQHGISSIENGILSKVVVSRQIEVEVEKKNPLAIFKRLFNSYKNANFSNNTSNF